MTSTPPAPSAADLAAEVDAGLIAGWHDVDEEGKVYAFDLAAKRAALAALLARCQEAERWLAWSGGNYPDDSPGDVIAVYPDGTIMLDDSVTTWNPLRALAFAMARCEDAERELDFKKKALRNCREAHLAAEARVAELEAARPLFAELHDLSISLTDERIDYLRDSIIEIARAALQSGGSEGREP